MNTKYHSFEAFECETKAQGFDESTQRDWPPNTVLAEHAHPFDAFAVVVKGEMWLSYSGHTRHIAPGDSFFLPRGTPHAERYGSSGASYWVARRH